jgi:hypothetical protein
MRTIFWCASRPLDGEADLFGGRYGTFPCGTPVIRPADEWAMPGLSDRIIAPTFYIQNYRSYISLSDCCLSIYLLNQKTH